MAKVFDIEFTTITVSGYSSNHFAADACLRPSYVKNSYVSSNIRKASRDAHHSTMRRSSVSLITAPVGLHGELMITPRVLSLATDSMSASVGRNPFCGSLFANRGVPPANATWSGKLTQYGDGMITS